jgi:phytoene dehydrogenase-like protein
MTANRRVVIVGAGMAGLTAAAYLAREQYSVLLIDKNERSGGLVHTFDYGGFSFDAGPRAFVNSGIVQPILRDLGISWEYLENRISIGVEDSLVRVDSMENLNEYERLLAKLYPENRGEIEEIISLIDVLSRHTRVLYEFDNPNFVDLKNNKRFVFRKLVPWTLRFLNALRKFNQFGMPVEETLEQLTDNQSLIDILIQHFFRKTPTYFALGYFYVYLDYFYPKGGTGALVKRLEDKVLGWGGDIRLNTRIVEVNPSQSQVIDSEGHSYRYDHLIWAADLKTLYRKLNLAGLSHATVKEIESTARRVLSSEEAESVFILFMAVDRPPSYFQERGGEHLFFTPSRHGLGEIYRGERQRLIEDFEKSTREDLIEWVDKYCDLNTYEVSVPALRDPALTPESQTGLSISCLFDYAIIEKIEEAGWYDEFKEAVEERIVRIFSQTIYEGLETDVLFRFSSTPLTLRKVAGSSKGAITGWSFETEIPVVSRLRDIPKSVLTPIPGVLQAGQWAYAPSGVPIAMLTGWYATKEIARRT